MLFSIFGSPGSENDDKIDYLSTLCVIDVHFVVLKQFTVLVSAYYSGILYDFACILKFGVLDIVHQSRKSQNITDLIVNLITFGSN